MSHPTPAQIELALGRVGVSFTFTQWNEAMELAKVYRDEAQQYAEEYAKSLEAQIMAIRKEKEAKK